MKNLLLLLIVLFGLSGSYITPVYASSPSPSLPAVFYCIGNNQKPPCATPAAEQSTPQPAIPATSSSNNVAPNTANTGSSDSSNSSGNPCTTSASVDTASTQLKTHVPEPQGALQQAVQYILSLAGTPAGTTQTSATSTSNPCNTQQYASPAGLQVQLGTNTVTAGEWSLTVEWNNVTQTTNGATVTPPTSYTASLIETINGKQTTLSTNTNVSCTTSLCTYSFKNVPVAASAEQPNIVSTRPTYTVQIKANTNGQIGESAYTIIPVLLGGDGPAATYAAPTGLQVQPGTNTVTAGKWNMTIEWNRVTQTTTGITVEPPTTYTLLLLKTENGKQTTLSGYQGALCTTNICTYSFKNISVSATSSGLQPNIQSTQPTYTVEIKANGNAQINSSANATLQVPLGGPTPGQPLIYAAPTGLQVQPGSNTVTAGEWNLTVEWNKVTETTMGVTVTPPTSYTIMLVKIGSAAQTILSTNTNVSCTTSVCTYSFKNIPVSATSSGTTQPIYAVGVKANTNGQIGESVFAPLLVTLGGTAQSPTVNPTIMLTPNPSKCLIHPTCLPGDECPDLIGGCTITPNPTAMPTQNPSSCLIHPTCKPGFECPDIIGACTPTVNPTVIPTQNPSPCLIHPTCKSGFECPDIIGACTPTQTPPTVSMKGLLVSNVTNGTTSKGKYCLDNYQNNPVIMLACNSADTTQKWASYSDDTIRINGNCLTEQGTTIGALVTTAACNGSTSQVWNNATKQGPTEFVNKQSNMCLDIRAFSLSNTQLEIYTCNGGGNQMWSWTTSSFTPPTGNIYTGQVESNTISGGEKLCLDNKNNTIGNGNPSIASACNLHTDSQQWVEDANGTIKSNTNQAYCLEASTPGTTNTFVGLYKCNGAANQVWQSKLITTGQAKGLTEFVSKQSGKCLTIGSGQVEMDTCNNSNNQVWNWRG